jgi:hypothetical protein
MSIIAFADQALGCRSSIRIVLNMYRSYHVRWRVSIGVESEGKRVEKIR